MVRILSKLGRKECTLREFKIIRPRDLARILKLFPIFSDEIEIISDEIFISSEIIWKMSLEIERTTSCFIKKQAVDLYEQAQITRKRAKYLQRVPKISIVKPSENRIISNNFFWIRIWVFNGGVGIVKMYVLRWRRVWEIYCCFLPKSIISFVNGDNLIVEQFVFVCFWYSGQRRVQKTTRCQQENNNDRKSTSP